MGLTPGWLLRAVREAKDYSNHPLLKALWHLNDEVKVMDSEITYTVNERTLIRWMNMLQNCVSKDLHTDCLLDDLFEELETMRNQTCLNTKQSSSMK